MRDSAGPVALATNSVTIASHWSGEPGELIVVLSGDLNTENAPAVSNALRSAFATPKPLRRVILDFRDVRYASSTGIGTITRLYIDARAHSVSLVLANVADHIRTVFDLLGFSSFFTFTTRE